MISESVLQRMESRISAYIQKFATRIGAEKTEEALDLFDSLRQLFPQWVIMTCPIMNKGIRYVSGNASLILGYDYEYLLNHAELYKFFKHVHEDDQKDLFECVTFLHDYVEQIPSEDHHTIRSVFHYRFRKGDGQFIHMHDEKAALRLHGGNLYYGLLRDVTTERSFSGVKVELYRQDGLLNKIKEFKPSSLRNSLSKREQELVTLIRQGLSIKEIAGYLGISHHTVRNIKSKLFEKYNVANSIELLNATA